MNELSKFYKITIQDDEMGCYDLKPFSYSELNDTTALTGGYTVTNSMKNRAINTFNQLSNNSTNSNKCCSPDDIISNPTDYAIYNDFITQYPKYRNIVNDNQLEYIELTTDSDKPSTENWKDMDALAFCRITKALSSQSLIKPTEDKSVFRIEELLGDCPTESCSPDNYHTVEDLFTGATTSTRANSRIQDKNIYYGIKNNSMLALVNYIKEYNNVNRIITFQGNKYRLLHLVAQYYNEKIMDAILAMKPQLDLKDGSGNTALHVAISANNYYAVEKILNAGASTNIKNTKEGMTPIMKALLVKSNDNIFNNYTYITLLHNSGASIYTTDNNGNNMLHTALLNDIDNIINIVNYLIDNGVELNVKNKFNKTPLQIVNEKTAHLSNKYTSIKDVEKLNKHDAGLLTAQTLIFNSIIKSNPDVYSDYINVDNLSEDVPLIEVIKHKCIGDNVSGFEDENECLLKGGEYKLLNNNNNLRVKFDMVSADKIDDDLLYMPKSVGSSSDLNIHPLIQKINENASKQLIETSTEDQYAGEYITRDVVSFNTEKFNNNNTENKKLNANAFDINEVNDLVDNLNVSASKMNVSADNIEEGFNNSKKYIIREQLKEYAILIISICLLLAFIILLYKLTV
jgi:ankyrin repeat protein